MARVADVDAARTAVDRAAALTHRLLAFARRQALQPKLVEPDALVEGMAELIRRTVGPSVEFVLRPADGIWTVETLPRRRGRSYRVTHAGTVTVSSRTWAQGGRIVDTMEQVRGLLGEEVFATLREV